MGNLGPSTLHAGSIDTDQTEVMPQSELPQPFPRNSVESDHGCTLRIDFDNTGDNVTLALYNVTQTSQKPC